MIRIQARGPSEAEILIHEAIGENWFGDGLTSRKFAEDLAKLGDVQKITVRINSPGGAVYDGVAIYNALRLHGARIHVLVEGLAASIASVIAMAGDEIEMGVGAMMMIHQPWTFAIGNADDMREIADVLDKHTEGLVDIYAKRTGRERAEIEQLLSGETWFTPSEAVAQKFADSVAEDEDEESEEEAKAAIVSHRKEYEEFVNEFRQHTAKLTPLQIAAAIKSAVADATQESEMRVKAAPASVQATDPPTPAPAPAPAAPAPAPAATIVTAPQIEAARLEGAQAEIQRRADVRARFARFAAVPEYSALLAECENDPRCAPQMAAEKLLAKLGANVEPARDPAAVVVIPGQDERDKRAAAAVAAVLARVGSAVYDPEGKKDKLPVVDNSNPYRGFSLYDIAEDSARRAGAVTRGMNRSMIVAAAFGHTTSDFPNLLENVMHKLLLVAYQGAEVVWPRIVRIGDVTDFRAQPRYRFGTFSDISEVNQAGNYPQGTVSDAEKETITAKRKGRIMVVSRELVVNDDLQALSDMARGMGRAATRTIDKDVFALFVSNGPTMGDSVALFNGTTTGHKNIAVTAAAPTVTSVDAARVQMAKQLDPSGNDFVGIRPAIVLSPLALGSTFRTLNDSQYDPDANSKLQRPNAVRGLFRDVVDSPRLDALSAQVWYVLADPNEEPVFEVGFLGGVREPRVEQQQEFSSDSLQWKVVHEYAVGAIGWRGILKNAGA